jgi:hypothetical protein
MEQDKSQLFGSWQLLSAQLEMADTKERLDLLGPSPVGRVIFTRNGRMATILTASGRTAGVDVPSTAALFGSMMAYSGTFRFEEGAKVVLSCDTAWRPEWAGTEQVRFYEFNGDRLTLRTNRQTNPSHPGREVYGIIEWKREH